MDARHSIGCCLLPISLLLCGCLTPDPSVDLLEGELRWMEDQLYMMEDQLEQRCRELNECRQANGDCGSTQIGFPTPAERIERRVESSLPAPVREPDQNRSVPELIERSTEPTPVEPADSLPPSILEDGVESENDSTDADTEFDLDNIPDDLLDEPQIQLPDPEPKPPGTRPQIETSDGTSTSSEPPLFLREEVEQLHINAARVSAHDAGVDQEKLLIVVEPQAQDDTYIELSAPMEVEIQDANQQGDQARLGTWSFDALETGRTFRTSNMGQGIHLALDWPRDVPLVDDLRIVVAYRRLDGKEIRSEKMLHPKVQATSVAGWVPVVRSRDVSAVASDAATPGVTDPFQLAAGSTLVKPPAVIQTVPIPTSVDGGEVNATASWSQPIQQPPGNKLTPVTDVKLEPIEARIFGDVTRDESATSSNESTRQPVSLQTFPIDEESRSDESHAEETGLSSRPAWTPYR